MCAMRHKLFSTAVEMLSREVIIKIMSKLKRYTMVCVVCATASVILLGPAALWAKKAPAGPPKIEASLPWMALVYALAALAGVCVIAFKNPGRTKSD